MGSPRHLPGAGAHLPHPSWTLKPRVGGGLHGYNPEIRAPLDLGWVLWAPCPLRTGKRRLHKPAQGSTEASRLSPPACFLLPALSHSSPFPALSQHSEPLGSLSDRSELRPLSQSSGTGRDVRHWRSPTHFIDENVSLRRPPAPSSESCWGLGTELAPPLKGLCT